VTRAHDAIVIGLGAMGSAAALALARRGARVLGLDRHAPPHAHGSSGGGTRIIREAYFEHPAYVPLVQRAYELWDALARDTGRALRRETGGLMIGPPDGVLVRGALRSAATHALHFEAWSAAQLAARVPVFRPPAGTVAVWEPRAGALFPEACVAAQLEAAARAGAELRPSEPAVAWEADGEGVAVRTATETLRAAHLVLAAGAWTARLVADLALPLRVQRQVQLWFAPIARAEAFAPERFPIYIWEDQPGRFIYGFPDLGQGIKIARHQEGEVTDPDATPRPVDDRDVTPMRDVIARLMPEANGTLRASAICLYTNAPDGHFVLGVHPAHPQVLLASPCSGHGFKFAPVIGETLAELALEGRTRHELRLFAPDRFATSARS